jgi:CRISPR system Cascade subunit CasB
MAQYLASKEQPANWDDVRQLLFSVDRNYSENVRLRIARSYYRTLYAQEDE